MSKLSQSNYDIVLHHDNGELKQVHVIYGRLYLGKFRKPLLVVQWPLAGEFSLDLKLNQLIKAPRWHALHINEAWKLWMMVCEGKSRDKREELPSYLRNDVVKANISGDIRK